MIAARRAETNLSRLIARADECDPAPRRGRYTARSRSPAPRRNLGFPLLTIGDTLLPIIAIIGSNLPVPHKTEHPPLSAGARSWSTSCSTSTISKPEDPREAEKPRSREAEKPRSREAEKPRSREAEKPRSPAKLTSMSTLIASKIAGSRKWRLMDSDATS
jgi:hypothetical protein